MKTAGVVLDFYDDSKGAILRGLFPTREDVPEIIKTAHPLSLDDRAVLRDEAFALILRNEGQLLRKFACVDPGNALLSALYFAKTAHLLPDEAREVAQRNINEAITEFGLVEELEKLALNGMSRTRDPRRQKPPPEDANWAQRTNVDSFNNGAMSSAVLPAASQMKTASAEGGGGALTDDERHIGVHTKTPDLQNKTPAIQSSATPLEPTPGAPHVNLRLVDVTGKAPKVRFEKKSAALYALGDRYPLDAFSDVQRAVGYFGENWTEFAPHERHEYAVKTAARADLLGIEVPELLRRYGSMERAPDIDAHLISRINNVAPEFQGMYEEMREKVASIEPEEMAVLLTQADQLTGLNYDYGRNVQDPYFSSFGGWAELDKLAHWSWIDAGGNYVTGDQLRKLALNGRPLIHKHFSSEITDGFCKDPITIFESMPEEHKKVFARLAADEYDGNFTN